MPDVSPTDFGVNVAARTPAGRLTREQAAAHARLASLPTVRHSKSERDMSAARTAAAEAAERARRTRIENGNGFKHAPEHFGQRGAKHPAMSGRTQREAILDALRQGPLTASEITARFMCTRASARIADLRDLGHDIATERVVEGERVTYRYRLIEEATK